LGLGAGGFLAGGAGGGVGVAGGADETSTGTPVAADVFGWTTRRRWCVVGRWTWTVTCGAPVGPAIAIPGRVTAAETCGTRMASEPPIRSTVVRVATKTTAAGASRSGTQARRTRPS
jgi:hypothetical protein